MNNVAHGKFNPPPKDHPGTAPPLIHKAVALPSPQDDSTGGGGGCQMLGMGGVINSSAHSLSPASPSFAGTPHANLGDEESKLLEWCANCCRNYPGIHSFYIDETEKKYSRFS